MPDYKELYFNLFAKIADASDALELGDSEKAFSILIEAQQRAEELYLREEA